MLNILVTLTISLLCLQAIYLSYKIYKLEKASKEKDKKLADWKKHCKNLETLQEYFMNHIDSLNSELKQSKEQNA